MSDGCREVTTDLIFLFQELNAVYNISGDKEGQQHILQSYNPGYLYDQQLPPHVPLHQHLPPHLPLHQLDTHQLSHPEDSAEPIYQNQGQILAQQQEREGEEPIYQNLPLHEKLNLPVGDQEDNLAESDASDIGSIHIDDTIDGVILSGEGGIAVEKEIARDDLAHSVVTPAIVSRVGITNSREDINEVTEKNWQKKSHRRASESPEKGKLFSEGEVVYSARGGHSNEPRKKLEMRQYLEPAVTSNIRSLDESLINTVNSSSLSLARAGNDSFDKISHFPSSDLGNSETLRKKSVTSVVSEEALSTSQARSKGRKRWGLNMAVKSGSLKSNKSEKSDGGSKSGDDSRHSSGRGMGAMMLANLHGNTVMT